MCPSIHFQVVDIAAFYLTKFKYFYSILMGLSFDINMKEYAPSKRAISHILSLSINFFCEVFSALTLGLGLSMLHTKR
jgi:hypothetical protein